MRFAVSMVAAITTVLVPSAGRSQPLVDHHQHLFSQSLTGQTSYNTIDAAQLVALLDSAGIQRAVVLSTAYQYSNPNRPAVPNEYEHVRAENDWTSREVARFPDRLRGFCSVNPLKDYALEEIARCAKDANLRLGLKLHFGNSDDGRGIPRDRDQRGAVPQVAGSRRRH